MVKITLVTLRTFEVPGKGRLRLRTNPTCGRKTYRSYRLKLRALIENGLISDSVRVEGEILLY